MPQPLWSPSEERRAGSRMHAFLTGTARRHGFIGSTWPELYRWSVEDLEGFWGAVWDAAEIVHSRPCEKVLDQLAMPGAVWMKGARLNFAANLLRRRDDRTALVSLCEHRPRRTLTYRELSREVARFRGALARAGVRAGDRVAGYVPNAPEAVIAMLAATSLGAIWSSSSPDFGLSGVLDRFGQIQPKVLVAADGYLYNGKRFPRLDLLADLSGRLPGLERVVVFDFLDARPDLSRVPKAVAWEEFVSGPAPELAFEELPFDHPVYILFSSGTTGVPKCIVHGAGGTLLQHAKELLLHVDLGPDDRIVYFTTCGWMMWNWLVSGLIAGATIVLYDGSPAYPDLGRLWRMADEEGLTIFGTSAKFLGICRNQGLEPRRTGPLGTESLASLRTILSTGSPLLPEDFDWVYSRVKEDVLLGSISGGTDLISCFVLANPLLPVHRGQIQCRGLGMAVEAWDESGRPVRGRKGELVCTRPFPSMPVRFWNDPDGSKYRKAYFSAFPGVWTHGDWIEITPEDGVVIYGRSDATLNPGGVRIGTAEIYRLVETLPEIADSLAIGQSWQGDTRIVLFVVLAAGRQLDEDLAGRIKKRIREGASPRHVPAKIVAVPAIPYTRSGKKVEMAVADVVHGVEPANKEALANPEALDAFRNVEDLSRP
ncbi:MAG: acetoacetate--CoA ligase [Planctomycetes bacterium]|nr:acetoacetate--CoA ligase [Planctomycetota bacterium]